MLSEQENAVHGLLAGANGMQILLDDLHDLVGAESPDDLIAKIRALQAGTPARVLLPGEGPTEPISAGDGPMEVDLEAGNHAWCSCGRSSNQPFCDGSHKAVNEAGGDHAPVLIKLRKPTKVKLCMCKQTSTPPYCDGTHAADADTPSEGLPKATEPGATTEATT